MRQPQATMMAGVRQLAMREVRDFLASSIDMPALCRSGGRRGKPLYRLLHDRQIDHGGEHAKQDGKPPDHVIRAGTLERDAAEPDAEESTDLMAEESKAEQHRQPACTKHQR